VYSPSSWRETAPPPPLKELLSNAPFKFAPPDGVAFFERLGWEAVDIRSILREGLRFRRVPLAMQLLRLLPNPNPRELRGSLWIGVVLLASKPTRRS
jgi:hypothetical protein